MKKKGKRQNAKKNGNAEKAKKRPRGTAGKQLDPSKVRENISKIVKNRARKITLAVANKAGQGELAPAKFFEMAHIFPQPPEGTASSMDDESFAKTLLDRLDIPDHPVVHDLYESGEDVLVTSRRAETKESQVQPSEQEQQKESVLTGVE